MENLLCYEVLEKMGLAHGDPDEYLQSTFGSSYNVGSPKGEQDESFFSFSNLEDYSDDCSFFKEIEQKDWVKSALIDETPSLEEIIEPNDHGMNFSTTNHKDFPQIFLPVLSKKELEIMAKQKRFYIFRGIWRAMMTGVVPKFKFSLGFVEWDLIKAIIGNNQPKMRRSFKRVWKLGVKHKKRVIIFKFMRKDHLDCDLFPWTKKFVRNAPSSKIFKKYEYKCNLLEVCLEYLPYLNELIVKGKYEKFYWHPRAREWINTA